MDEFDHVLAEGTVNPMVQQLEQQAIAAAKKYAASKGISAVQVSDENLERDFVQLVLSEVSSRNAVTASDFYLTLSEQNATDSNSSA